MSRSPQIPDSREAAPLRQNTPVERRGVEDISLAAPRVSDNQAEPSTADSQERELHPAKPAPDRIRAEYRGRNRTYRLRDSEIIALAQIGVFRAVNKDDLAQYAYAGDQARMESDLRNLLQQSLIERHTLAGSKGDTPTIVSLTRDGQKLLRRSRILPTDQATYHGFRKPKEIRGGEAFDLLQLLNTGHSGTLSTVHASSAAQALARFTSCVLQSGIELPYRAIKSNIADSLNVLIQLERRPGKRFIAEVLELRGYNPEADRYDLFPIFSARV